MLDPSLPRRVGAAVLNLMRWHPSLPVMSLTCCAVPRCYGYNEGGTAGLDRVGSGGMDDGVLLGGFITLRFQFEP